MFTTIQILLILFILFALSRVVLRAKEKVISAQVAFFWTFIWLSALTGVMLPDTTTKLAAYFGVGRGVDVIVYFALAILFYLTFRIFVMLEDIRQEITYLVRIIALQPHASRYEDKKTSKKKRKLTSNK